MDASEKQEGIEFGEELAEDFFDRLSPRAPEFWRGVIEGFENSIAASMSEETLMKESEPDDRA